MQLRFLSAATALVATAALGTAQAVTEIPVPTVATSFLDFDLLPAGATTVAAINAIATGGGVSNIIMTPNIAAAGVYDTNATQNGLGLVGGGLAVVAPLGAFTAFDLQIDLNGPSTEIGFGIGDWNGPMIIDFSLGGILQTTFTSSAYSAAALFKYYQMTGSSFDQVNVRASTTAGNWVLVDLEVQNLNGLFANFVGDVTSGASPLTVNFTDLSFSSDPGGVQSWTWDLDGDTVPDSFVQNPSFNYTTCGNFDVTLTVTDLANPASTITKTAYIEVDAITASFTYSLLAPPNVYQFTDTSTPPATAWAWDLDGDTVPDSFVQNPVGFLPACAATNVTLTATRNCQSDSVTQSVFASANSLSTLFAADNGGASGWIVYSDFNVTNPQGITICAFDHQCGTAAVGTAFTFDVYVTETSYVGKEFTAGAWQLVGSGAGTAQGNDIPSLGTLNAPIHLPFGSYGVGIIQFGTAVRYTGLGAGAQGIYSDANLTITTGASQATPWSSAPFSFRQWNGGVYYDTCADNGAAAYGYFGSGCAGTLPVGGQTINNPPVMGGNLSLTFDNLPFDVTIVMLGFSNTFATGFGPLPFDLTILGMTGCIARVSPDLTFFIIGAAGSATLSLSIPTDPVFLCVPIYTQGLTPDPVGNPFGWVLSDAAGGPIGN